MTLLCAQLDEFFDGVLSAEAAEAFRAHLATCPRCQPALLGRMQETMVVEEAAPAAVARRSRSRFVVGLGAALAVAAAVVLVLRSRGADAPTAPQVALVVAHGDTVVRGSAANVGDRVTARANGPLWVYRGDHELVLACPGAPPCGPEGADVLLRERGVYSFVVIASDAKIPAPRGSFDEDVAAAVKAGARYKVETIDVQ